MTEFRMLDQALDAQLDSAVAARLASDYDRFADSGLPQPLEAYVLDTYRLNLTSEYGGLPIRNPFGKASGQLSLNLSQVQRDANAGLGFVVLKTFIAQDASGAQSMAEWAIPETRMHVEPIVGSGWGAEGQPGWTVTWKGRGWYDTFEAYLRLFAEALAVGYQAGMAVAPSVKYHLPRDEEPDWKIGEYEYTTRRLLEVWDECGLPGRPMPIEKDFSPTLAGSERAAQKANIRRWLANVTRLIRQGAARDVHVAVKVMNAMFDDAFQLEILGTLAGCTPPARPDSVVYANRLFDPEKEFLGARGVAYGGPDLSARNLKCLAWYRAREQRGELPALTFPISATGNVDSGSTAAQYLLCGASSFQMHTWFQLNESEYVMKRGNKSECVLHEFLFHPDNGFIAALLRLRRQFAWPEHWDVARMARFCADPANRLWAESRSLHK